MKKRQNVLRGREEEEVFFFFFFFPAICRWPFAEEGLEKRKARPQETLSMHFSEHLLKGRHPPGQQSFPLNTGIHHRRSSSAEAAFQCCDSSLSFTCQVQREGKL